MSQMEPIATEYIKEPKISIRIALGVVSVLTLIAGLYGIIVGSMSSYSFTVAIHLTVGILGIVSGLFGIVGVNKKSSKIITGFLIFYVAFSLFIIAIRLYFIAKAAAYSFRLVGWIAILSIPFYIACFSAVIYITIKYRKWLLREEIIEK